MRFLLVLVLVLLLTIALAQIAGAHEIERLGPQTPRELIRAWSFEPGIIIPLLLSAILYGCGLVRLRKVSPSAIANLEIIYFAVGWLALVLALVSPLHPWGSVLFSAHMTQHEILMLVAAPFLVLGRPLIATLWTMPKRWARALNRAARNAVWQAIWRVIANPFAAWLIGAVVLWIWHLPWLFQATLENEFIHALQHISFLFSALLFWWAILHGRQRILGYGAAVLYMFTTALQSGLLGALLTFARTLWYPIYAARTAAWGLTPLEDQQLGGLIMWVPAGLVYIIAGLALFAGWLRESGNRAANLSFTDAAQSRFPTAHRPL